MNYVRVVNGVVVDTATKPSTTFHPTIAAEFVEAPDNVSAGWMEVDGVWVAPTEDEVTPVVDTPPVVTVVEYKMLFTSMERIAVKNSTDQIIMDLQELMNDPRVRTVDLSLQSVNDALDYMTALGILAEGRKAEILTGVIK